MPENLNTFDSATHDVLAVGPLLTDSIRSAIRESHLSQSELSRRSEVGPSALSRFMGGIGGLSLDSLNRIVAALGIVLVSVDRWRQMENVWRAYEAGRLRQVTPPEDRTGGTVTRAQSGKLA